MSTKRIIAPEVAAANDPVVVDSLKRSLAQRNSAGKGSSPRSCFSPEFRRNWDRIFRRRHSAR